MTINNATSLKAIAICGPISSGKSSIIRSLSKEFDWDIISFGDYVRFIAKTKSLEITRSILQEVGEELIKSTDPEYFLKKVIEFNDPKSNIHLYDGVRHLKIVDALQQIYPVTSIIFLHISDFDRYNRYISRSATGDPLVSFDDFIELSSRPTEKEITDISLRANLCIDASLPIASVLEQVIHHLRLSGIIDN